MGIHEGFDMVPRLTGGTEDVRKWTRFIDIIQKYYQDDDRFKLCNGYIEFTSGEHPMLPLDGNNFVRFSSKVCGDGSVCGYIRSVRQIAESIFGFRIRPWTESADQYGFYDLRDVHDSYRYSFENTAMTASRFAGDSSDYPSNLDTDNLFEALEIPSKGRGLVARCNIRSGTRILCEKPLLIIRNTSPELLHRDVASKLKSLSKEEQRQFLSLHNNFPGRHAFAGIVKTNALPCGPGAIIGGIFPKICRINHSCFSNCHNSWNDETQQETIHAIKDILAGEEITISYDHSGPASVRQAHLQPNFGFNCQCELCTLPPEELQASDNRRGLIQQLDEQVGDAFTMSTEPLVSLQACQALLGVLIDEYGSHDMALIPRLYYDAFQIAITHGDQARAKVFAERSYKARVACEGEDSPATKKVKGLMQNPASHSSFALCSKMWKTSKTSQPKNLGINEFEKWLWRH
ncbi:hypothetical protein E0Z10_g6675 [Xylaria hypoxylon]|uniref:SET domain-containing protein n=1 Tax=Xylaria hypoxylon TaxID=37992 RepID=A0A4Z0YFM4_9PEZI|nr:hypothetical protein E0Z10_g6675 [Xylaria hypoxylon]